MKKKSVEVDPKQLTRKELREIELELKIFLDKPKNPFRTINQQFGVYDEEEKFVGDILAVNLFFTKEELIEKIKLLFK